MVSLPLDGGRELVGGYHYGMGLNDALLARDQFLALALACAFPRRRGSPTHNRGTAAAAAHAGVLLPLGVLIESVGRPWIMSVSRRFVVAFKLPRTLCPSSYSSPSSPSSPTTNSTTGDADHMLNLVVGVSHVLGVVSVTCIDLGPSTRALGFIDGTTFVSRDYNGRNLCDCSLYVMRAATTAPREMEPETQTTARPIFEVVHMLPSECSSWNVACNTKWVVAYNHSLLRILCLDKLGLVANGKETTSTTCQVATPNFMQFMGLSGEFVSFSHGCSRFSRDYRCDHIAIPGKIWRQYGILIVDLAQSLTSGKCTFTTTIPFEYNAPLHSGIWVPPKQQQQQEGHDDYTLLIAKMTKKALVWFPTQSEHRRSEFTMMKLDKHQEMGSWVQIMRLTNVSSIQLYPIPPQDTDI